MNKALIQKIKSARQVLILTHTDPDGDALGSCCLMQEIIKHLNPGAKINIKLDPQHKAELNYFIKKIKAPALTKKPDLIISVDASNIERLYGLNDNHIDIMVDHHTGNSNFGKINIIEPAAASCTLVIYSLLQKAKIKLTKAMAGWLYLGLCSDTGNFSFANTDERTFAAALACVRAGVNPNAIFNKLNEQLKHREIIDFAKALARTESHCGGKLILSTIPAALEVDNRNLIDYIRREKNAEAAVVLVEKKDHIKLSFRSKTKLNVAVIAAKFNGGGHKKAAAGKIYNTTLDTAKNQIISYFTKHVFLKAV